MAIYKPPKPRWPLAVFSVVVGLLLGIGLGLLIGRDEPNAAEGVQLIRTELTAAAAGLEVAGIEYAESVEGGEVTNETEYQGALDAVESSRQRFAAVSDALALLAPERADEIEAAYGEVAAAMEAREETDEVEGLLTHLAAMLKGDDG